MKKAHEQIALEAEIAAQVRKDVQQGKGSRFREAVNSSPLRPLDDHRPSAYKPSRLSTASSPVHEEEASAAGRREHEGPIIDSPQASQSRQGGLGVPDGDGAGLASPQLHSPQQPQRVVKGGGRPLTVSTMLHQGKVTPAGKMDMATSPLQPLSYRNRASSSESPVE